MEKNIKETNMALMLFRTIDNILKQGKPVKAGTWQADDTFKDYEMKVQFNVTLELEMLPTKEELEKATSCSMPWSEVHFQERIEGRPLNPGESYKIWPYNTFKPGNDPYMTGELFSHTYMERFWPRLAGKFTDKELKDPNYMGELYEENMGTHNRLGDLNDVIKMLKDNPETRQAYLPIFFPEDTGAVHGERVPCTLGYFFWLHDGKLHCNYIIRSCDVFRHFRNDVYLTGRLQQHVANKIGAEIGTMTMFIFNLHFFENDRYNITKREDKICQELAEKS